MILDDSLLSSLFCFIASLLFYRSGCTVLASFFIIFGVYFIVKIRKNRKIVGSDDFEVCIIGAGFSGICIAKKLNDLGIRYTILEKSPKLGGTWRENTYPGLTCDVRSHLYSFSFFLNPNWSKSFSKGPEILDYLVRAAGKFSVFPHIRFNKKVVRCTWNEQKMKWLVELEDGSQMTPNILIPSTGSLHVPKTPHFPGKDLFLGDSFHTARWKPGFDPAGKKVAVIGTGASAVQVIPCLADMNVDSLLVFQRTPCWAPPKMDFEYPQYVKKLFAFFPLANRAHRYFIFWRQEIKFCILWVRKNVFFNNITSKMAKETHEQVKAWVRSTVKDQELAEKLIPTYDMGCKRITPSDQYINTFNKPFVHLITDTIESIAEEGIKTKNEALEHKVDAIIYATGFDLHRSVNPFEVIGLNGISLETIYGDTPSAYLGLTHPCLPNMFSLLGPGSGLGHSSMIYMAECQANYAADAIVKMLEEGCMAICVKEKVFLDYVDWARQAMKAMVFGDNNQCSAWYRNKNGINWVLWPAGLVRFWWNTRSCDLNQYNQTF